MKIEINYNENINTDEFDIRVNHLNEYEKRQIDELIEKHNTVFAKDKYDTGTIKDYEARIDLIVDKYCSKRPYRCTEEDRKEIETKIIAKKRHN